jgi:hypothetical protein
MLQLTGVSAFDSMDAVIRIMAIALPIAVLLTLLMVLLTKWRAKRRRTAVHFLDNEITPDVLEAALITPPADMAVGSQPETPVARFAETSIDDMQARLSHSLAHAPKPAQASLYLQIAQLHRSQGDEAACLTALRAAAGLAAQHGPRSAHAEARLELAEVAYNAGDLTGACEQWQIARTALLDDGQKDAHAHVDKRMRDNGCPTDWVLTDF